MDNICLTASCLLIETRTAVPSIYQHVIFGSSLTLLCHTNKGMFFSPIISTNVRKYLAALPF